MLDADQVAALTKPVPNSLTAIRDGAEPHPAMLNAIIARVVRNYPHGGNQLEAALRMAVRLGWRGRHQLQLNREEAQKP